VLEPAWSAVRKVERAASRSVEYAMPLAAASMRFRPPAHSRIPAPLIQPDIHQQAQLAGDGAGQVDGESGGLAVVIQKLIGGIVAVAADDDAAAGEAGARDLGEPFCVEAAKGAVGHDEGQAFVQDIEQGMVALAHGETELLGEQLRADGHEVGESRLLHELEGDEFLDDHRVVPSGGEFPQGGFVGVQGNEAGAGIAAAEEFMGVVALHDGHLLVPEVGQRKDIRVVVAHDEGAVHGEIGKRKVVEVFALGGAAHERERLEAAFGQIGLE
jgi:hypothetical protein